MRDCTVPKGNAPPYHIVIDGEMTLQNMRFNTVDLAFWGFALTDVSINGVGYWDLDGSQRTSIRDD